MSTTPVKQTLFEFVSIRKPQDYQYLDQQLRSIVIPSNSDYKNLTLDSLYFTDEVFNRLRTCVQERGRVYLTGFDLSDNFQRNAMLEQVFQGLIEYEIANGEGLAFPKSEEQIDLFFNSTGFAKMIQWFSSEKTSKTQSDFIWNLSNIKIGAIQMFEISPYGCIVSGEYEIESAKAHLEILYIWLSVKGSDPRALKVIGAVLRILNIAQKGMTFLDSHFSQLLNIDILIDTHWAPYFISGPQSVTIAPTTPEEDPNVAAFQHLDLLRKVVEELETNILDRKAVIDQGALSQIEDSTSTESEGPTTTYQDPAVIAGFDELTLSSQVNSFLTNPANGHSINVPLTRTIEKVRSQIQKTQGEIAKRSKPNDVGFVTGGAVWFPNSDTSIDEYAETEIDELFDGIVDDHDGFYQQDGVARIKPLGVLDYLRVEQTLNRYEPGEIAHIENILASEYKEIVDRKYNRKEDTTTKSSESDSETQNENSSSDRYSLQKEIANQTQKSISVNANTTFKYKLGTQEASGGAGLSANLSKNSSDKNSVQKAKDVTTEAVEKVSLKIKNEQITKLITEHEETTKHGFDNTAKQGGPTPTNIIAEYHFMDKIFDARVLNYGKRLIFEMMVPEPAAFHLWTCSKGMSESAIFIEKPLDPRSEEFARRYGTKMTSFDLLDIETAIMIASQFGVDLPSVPPFKKTTSKSFAYSKSTEGKAETSQLAFADSEIPCPEGYYLSKWAVSSTIQQKSENAGVGLTVNVNGQSYWNDGLNGGTRNESKTVTSLEEMDTIAVSVSSRGFPSFYSINIVFTFEAGSAMLNWKKQAYNLILKAYNEKLEGYNQKLSDFKNSSDKVILGTNPARNIQIIERELKRTCIEWMNGRQNLGSVAVDYSIDDDTPPVTTFSKRSILEGERAKFFESVFDWNLMSYEFLPYFWANRKRWKKMYQLNDSDPLFNAFLSSGMAKIYLTVVPGNERKALYFLKTGKIWLGDEVPGFDNPMYKNIIADIEDVSEDAPVQIGDSWEIRVPTSHVKISS